jgi:2-hydroxychromene-2-carboxylate isomerase
MSTKQNPRYYFSFRSPYAWIATRMIADRLTPAEHARIDFVPYWEPQPATLALLRARGCEFLYQPMSREKHLYILQDVKRITRSLGLKHIWPIDRDAVWELPIKAYLLARQLGKAAEFREVVYRARWQDGANIHCGEVLEQLGNECGIQAAEIGSAANSPAIEQEAVECLVAAWNDGVFGIPFFKIGNDKFWGVDRLSAFVAAMRGQAFSFEGERCAVKLDGAAPEEDAPWPLDVENAVGRFDTDAAGGCG